MENPYLSVPSEPETNPYLTVPTGNEIPDDFFDPPQSKSGSKENPFLTIPKENPYLTVPPENPFLINPDEIPDDYFDEPTTLEPITEGYYERLQSATISINDANTGEPITEGYYERLQSKSLANQITLEEATPPPEESFFSQTADITADIGRGVAYGVIEGVEELADSGWEFVYNAYQERRFKHDRLLAWASGDKKKLENVNKLLQYEIDSRPTIELPNIDKPEGFVGGGAAGISQFIAGYVAGGKALKAVNGRRVNKAAGEAVEFVSKKAEFALASIKGAFSDGFAHDPFEERFSHFINDLAQEYPELENPLTEWLAADEDDSRAMARFKGSLEGLGLGVAAEGLFMAIGKGWRAARGVHAEDGAESADEFIDEYLETVGRAADELDEVEKKIDELEAEEISNLPALRDQQSVQPREEFISGEDAARADATGNKEPPEKITVEQATNFVDWLAAERGFTFGEGRFNTNRMGGDEDAIRMAQARSNTIAKDPTHPSHKPQTNKETVEKAKDMLSGRLGVSVKELADTIAQDAKNLEEITSRMVAGKELMQSMDRELAKLLKKIADKSSETNDRELLDAMKLLQDINDLESNLMGVRTWTARTTQAGRIHTKDSVSGELIKDEFVQEQLRGLGGSEFVKKTLKEVQQRSLSKRHRKMLSQLRSKLQKQGYSEEEIVEKLDEALAKAVSEEGQKVLNHRFADTVNTVYTNSLLSGVSTQQVSLLSGALRSLTMPLERVVGGVHTGMKEGNWEDFQEGMRIYAGLYRAVFTEMDTIKQSLKTLKDEENVLDIEHRIFDHKPKAISAKEYGVKEDSVLGKTINIGGAAIRIPSRLLTTQDEFFKQINYRAVTYAEAKRALKADPKLAELTKGEKEQYIQKFMDKAFTKSGAGRRERGMEYARRVTFTGDLEYGFGRSFQEFFGRHPMLRPLMPFIRTPVNIVREVWASTPVINRWQRQWMERYNAGGTKRTEALGQMYIGTALYGAAAMVASTGKLHGALSSNPSERKLQREKGIVPYSYEYTDAEGKTRYWQFKKMDPWAMFFGVVADMQGKWEDMDEAEASEVTLGLISAVIQNLNSKSTLTNLSEALEAMSDPEKNLEYFIGKSASGFVPNGMMQVSELLGYEDPYLRATYDIADQFQAKVPFLAKDLAPRRSWITGKPVEKDKREEWYNTRSAPISADKGDPLMDEFVRLGHGFTAPPRKIGNIELDAREYDKLLELHGTVKRSGRTLRESLLKEMAKRRYQSTPLTDDEYTSYHVQRFNRIIGGYRERAIRTLLRHPDFVELAQKVEQDKQNKRNAKRGRVEKITPTIQ